MKTDSITIREITIHKDDLSFVKKEDLTLMVKLKSKDNINYFSYDSEEELNKDFHDLYSFFSGSINQG